MANQIESLRIHAFRRLKDLELHKLGRVNLFVGVNNSGKTSVLEAIAAHCRPLEPLRWIATARRREVKASLEPVLDAMRWLFPQHGAAQGDPYYRGEVRVEGSGRFPNLETRAMYVGILGAPDEEEYDSYSEDGDDDEEESSESPTSTTPPPDARERGADITLSARVPPERTIEFGADQRGVCTERFRLWENQRFVSRSAPPDLWLPVATVSPFEHRVQHLQVSKLSEATLKGTKFSAIELIRLIDADTEDLHILSRTGARSTLYVLHRRSGFTPISALGDGVRRVLAIALSLTSVQHGALLIDEIETAIHKDALTSVFQWLVRACNHFDVQLFATTHSLEAIDALLTAQVDDPSAIVAYQLPDRCEGTVKRFEGDILDNLRFERGLDIR